MNINYLNSIGYNVTVKGKVDLEKYEEDSIRRPAKLYKYNSKYN